MKSLIFYLTILLCFISCKPVKDGDYLIYNDKEVFNALFMVSPITSYNSDIKDHLKSAFMGRKMHFEFNQDYITMNCVNSNIYNDLILNQKYGPDSIEYYYGERIVGQTTMEFRLMRNDTKYLILAVDCSMPQNQPVIVPIQFGMSSQPRSNKTRVIFCLKKVD